MPKRTPTELGYWYSPMKTWEKLVITGIVAVGIVVLAVVSNLTA